MQYSYLVVILSPNWVLNNWVYRFPTGSTYEAFGPGRGPRSVDTGTIRGTMPYKGHDEGHRKALVKSLWSNPHLTFGYISEAFYFSFISKRKHTPTHTHPHTHTPLSIILKPHRPIGAIFCKEYYKTPCKNFILQKECAKLGAFLLSIAFSLVSLLFCSSLVVFSILAPFGEGNWVCDRRGWWEWVGDQQGPKSKGRR